ncbi:MAG TPA: RNA polymerase sigma-70 factor [Puia sp.]|nr:RNA polymerase sigma-70 factor [Puia sp.]
MDQQDIIQQLQQRIALYEDMKAYKELYDLLFKGLHRFSYAFVKSSEAAEEIVSDVFVKLWQIRSRLSEIENLRVYLFTIAKNFSLNYINKNYKTNFVSLDAVDIEAVVELKSPEDIYISADIINKIKEAIQKLPPQCRIIFQLVKEDGMKYKEVAAVLHISPLTVRNQLAIATKKIGDMLPAYLQQGLYRPDKFSKS